MRIQELNIDNLISEIEADPNKFRSFYSKTYKRTFITKEEVLKLEPIQRKDCERFIPLLEKSLNEVSSQTIFPKTFKENEHAIYGYRTPSGRLYNRPINLCIRTSSDNGLVDDFLEAYLDTILVVNDCDSKQLDILFNSKADAYISMAKEQTRPLIDRPVQDLVYVPKGRRGAWIEDGLKIKLYTILQMQTLGYGPKDILEGIKPIKVLPNHKTENSLLWNYVLTSFESIK